MAREIKFRAWDVIEMIPHERISFDRAFEYMLEYGNNIKLMQYTGLKDKNGKEIFEGDIIKVQLPMGGFWGNAKKEKVGAVRFESDFGSFIVEWEYSKNQHHIRLDCDIAFEAEVLGNIHQNPNLLTP